MKRIQQDRPDSPLSNSPPNETNFKCEKNLPLLHALPRPLQALSLHLGCSLLGFLGIVQKEIKQIAGKVGQWDSEVRINIPV